MALTLPRSQAKAMADLVTEKWRESDLNFAHTDLKLPERCDRGKVYIFRTASCSFSYNMSNYNKNKSKKQEEQRKSKQKTR